MNSVCSLHHHISIEWWIEVFGSKRKTRKSDNKIQYFNLDWSSFNLLLFCVNVKMVTTCRINNIHTHSFMTIISFIKKKEYLCTNNTINRQKKNQIEKKEEKGQITISEIKRNWGETSFSKWYNISDNNKVSFNKWIGCYYICVVYAFVHWCDMWLC